MRVLSRARGAIPRISGVVALLFASCAAAPAGPRGPLVGPGIEAATDFSYAYGAGDVTVSDGTRVRGSADNLWSSLTIIPRRLEGRVSPLPWVDMGGHLGWLESGADARVGLPAIDDRSVAANLAVGLQTGSGGRFKDTKSTRSKWLRLELYPRVRWFGALNTWLVLASGIHAGTFYHELGDPRPNMGFTDGPSAPDAINLVRHETRLETSVGLFVLPGKRRVGSLLLTISPYFNLDSGAPMPPCAACVNEVASYHQSWGIVFVFRGAFRYGF